MAVREIGRLQDVEAWDHPIQAPVIPRITASLLKFLSRKPLGAVCGIIVLIFAVVGDLVPETINRVSSVAGISDQPVPYFADELANRVSFIYPFDAQDIRARLEPASSEHILGTDQLGRDILSRLIYGTRTAVMVSFGAVLISSVLQIIISVPAGYYGGWYDKTMYRFVDVFDALPSLIVLIAVLGIFGAGLWPMIFTIGVIFGFGGRVLRGQTIALKATPYMEAARVIGANDLRIMTRYVLPNLMPLIILTATLRLGIIVLLEASLSFLGYGMPPPFPSWGQMLSLDGRQFMRSQPGLAIYPGVAIGVLVFSFNLFGDALRDVLDPRLRGSR